MRRLTVLLFRDEGPGEDENIGCVGNYGSEWRHAPEMFERFNVVDEAAHERLVEALEECRDAMEAFNRAPGATRDEWEFECEVKEIDTLLATLEAEKWGE